MKSRKERRAEARENGVAFEPQYNGGRIITKAQYEQEVAEAKQERKEENARLRKLFNKSLREEAVTETTTEAEATE
jgi:hypothetical protein